MDELEQAKQKKEEMIEERNLTYWISGEYLSAACHMVAWQFIDQPTLLRIEKQEFEELCALYLRHHTPIAYSYIFQNHHGEGELPIGTLEIIRDYIRKHHPEFLGGLPNGGIIIP